MITGSGIMVMELYKMTPVIVLFGLNKFNFSDPGGTLNWGETPEMGACRECKEETANLINIHPHELIQISTSIVVGSYKSHIIYIKNLKALDYVHNVNKIFTTCTDLSWKETNTITRIRLSDIITASNSNQYYVNDIYGHLCNIRNRTMGLIKKSAHILTSLVQFSPISLHKQIVTYSHLSCLIGTYSYTIMNNNINNIIPNIKYAIYIVPYDSTILKCNTNIIPHITISGFSNKYDYPTLKNIIYTLTSNWETKKWKISIDTLKLKNKSIQFKSKTLDEISHYLHKNNVKKIKGPHYVTTNWNIKIQCDSFNNIKQIFRKMKWYLCIVSKNNNKLIIHNKIIVRVML